MHKWEDSQKYVIPILTIGGLITLLWFGKHGPYFSKDEDKYNLKEHMFELKQSIRESIEKSPSPFLSDKNIEQIKDFNKKMKIW